jgi:chromosome segregation ATPase
MGGGMKKDAKIISILAFLLFILGIAGLTMSILFTKEYKIKIALLEQHNNDLVVKLDDFKKSLNDFRFSLEGLKGDNATSLKDILAKLNALEADKKEIILKITSLADDLQSLQKSYLATANDLKELRKSYAASLGKLKTNLDNVKGAVTMLEQQRDAKVDLGEISVENQSSQ